MVEFFRYDKITLLIVLFFIGKLSAQKLNNINYPPDNPTETNILLQDSLVNIYITKKYKVFVDSEEMVFWDEIISAVMKRNREWGLMQTLLSNVIIHSDADVDYNFVDRVKEEVGRSNKKIFYYRVGNNNKVGYEFSINPGTVRGLWTDERIKQINGNALNSFSITNINNPLPSNPAYSTLISEVDEFKENLYQQNKDKIESFISSRKAIVLTLLPDGKINSNGTLLNPNGLKNLFEYEEGQVVLVFFDDNLKYLDYISFLQRLEEIEINEKNISFNRNFVIEVSKSLEKKLEEIGLNFN